VSHPERIVERSTVVVLQGNFENKYDSYALPLIEFQYKNLSSQYIFSIDLGG
jgi:hypothetical protein